MASPVWKGSLSFGLVNVPVRLYGATERHGVRFHQFERGTSDRIRYRRVNERTGEEVAPADIIKGANVDDSDEYVVLEPQELESIAPGRSRTLEISAFVPAGAVEPLWYNSTYYLAPDAKTSAKPYNLLCAVLERAERVGVARLVMRERQHLSVIGPQNGVLTLSTLWWADEVRDPDEVLPAIPETDLAGREMELAGQLIESMAEEWRPEAYSDAYQERLGELIDAKHEGRRLRYRDEGPPKPRTNVVELTEALRASLGSGTGTRKGKGRKAGRAAAPRQAPPVSEMSKTDLSRLAAELKVPGRSKMSRADLEKAVSRAQRETAAS
ncbi:Ku protein [Nocardiopsis sediminis]|uniref:Non-homologous end joining protein Ku n=1 Tax=Nocardiopsis sediminis TaxID=1778267 RepID=A0ABV8FGY1_9ACTN